jgi:CheY-like chemotaxis protein
VTSRPAGPYVRLTVRDQGPGITRELQARVLEPFFTTKPGGSGLGLATVYSIVRRHGGHLEIESEEGAGAAFHVFLPAVPGESAALGPASAPEPAPVPTSARVLVMDDEDYVRDVARQMLTRLGYDVLVAKDDSEAVDLLRAADERGERVDVAILDITIPGGLGGAAALQRLREVAPRLPAIASSGYSGDTIMARPAEHGFDGALPKPYTLANIRAVMGSVLSARRA